MALVEVMGRLDLDQTQLAWAILNGELVIVMDGRRALIELDEVIRYEWRHKKVLKHGIDTTRPRPPNRR